MIGHDTAREGIALLGTAIGEILEDATPTALDVPRSVAGDGLTKFRVLRSVGEDVALLASAIGVLARRAEEHRSHELPAPTPQPAP